MGVDVVMFMKFTKQVPSKEFVHQAAVDMASAFGAERFWISKDEPHSHHALRWGRKDYGEDPREVHLCTLQRYYGPGYERGDLPFILCVWEYLRAKFDAYDPKIYYGDDCSDDHEELTDALASKLWRHFVEHGHQPYRGSFGTFFGDMEPPVCTFCKVPMTNCGGGGGDSFYTCNGCDDKWIQNKQEMYRIDGDFFARKRKDVK